MPCQSRIDTPGALHHVMIRGIERTAIFRDDRESFLDRFGDILLESSTPCYAWSLLSTHAHLLLRTGKNPISLVMRRLLTGYAVSFNRRRHRNGHLFQNRYKSISVAKELGMSPSAVSKLIVRAKPVSGHEDIGGNFL